MTTLAAPLPKPSNLRMFFLIVILAFLSASFGAFLTNAWISHKNLGEVTVKPCATCPNCVCKPLLGGPRCGCPQ